MSGMFQKKGGAHLDKKVRVRKPKKVRSRQEKIKLAVIIILSVVLVLLLLVAAVLSVYRSWAKPPEIPVRSPIQMVEGDEEPVDNVPVSSDRKDDFYTFLVVGRDTGGGGNTDTMLLAAYDIPNQKLNVMSIPRDTMVNLPYDLKKINRVYNDGGGGETGVQALCTEVSHLVGFVPDFSIVVEWKAVGELVDAIGGVWFDVPRNMNYDDPTQNLHIHQAKGYRHLTGDDAMQVIRWRKNNDGTGYGSGDIGRIETQQAFLKVVVEQCLKIENVTKIQDFAKIFTENVETDLTVGNLAWFAEQAIFGGLKMEDVSFITMPGNYNGYAWCRAYQVNESYVLPYGDELLEVVNESFNPYLEDRTADLQDIMSVNADGSLSSSSGVVKDTQAAKPPVRPATTPKPDPTPDVSDDPEPSTTEDTTEPNVTEPDVTEPNVTEPPVTQPPEDPATSADPDETGEPADDPPSETTPPPESSNSETAPEEPENEPPAEADPIPTPTPWTPPPEVVVP